MCYNLPVEICVQFPRRRKLTQQTQTESKRANSNAPDHVRFTECKREDRTNAGDWQPGTPSAPPARTFWSAALPRRFYGRSGPVTAIGSLLAQSTGDARQSYNLINRTWTNSRSRTAATRAKSAAYTLLKMSHPQTAESARLAHSLKNMGGMG